MADNAVVHIGENSPEEVAYKMMTLIMNVENRESYAHGKNPVDRAWVLRTYAQCMRTVRNPHQVDDIVPTFAPAVPPKQ